MVGFFILWEIVKFKYKKYTKQCLMKNIKPSHLMTIISKSLCYNEILINKGG